MEYALCLLGAEQTRLRRLGRKREREADSITYATDTGDSPGETPSTSPPADPTDKNEDISNVDIDEATRHHICSCIVHICEKTQALSSGKSFVARSTLGVFLAAQSAAPQHVGPVWAALLYVCFETVSESYTNGLSSPRQPERVRTFVLVDMLRFLGTMPQTASGADTSLEFVRWCRRLSRFETNALVDAVDEAWRITEIPRVRLAMEGVLSNCAHAKYLFS
jgi:hypothetical protein